MSISHIGRIYYELTTKCNLRCAHCFNYNAGYSDKFIDIQSMFNFHKMVESQFETTSVLTGGEPLLHPQFVEIVEFFNSRGRFCVTTNATLFTNEYYEELLSRNKNLFFQISVDGFTKETFEKMRGTNTYDRVMERINYLVTKGYGKRIGISTTITNYNKHEIIELVNWAEKLQLHSIHFPTLIHEGRCESNNYIIPKVEEITELEELLLQRCIESKKTNISINTLNQIASWQNIKSVNSCLESPTLKITPSGEIMPCPVAWEEKYSLGNIVKISSLQQVHEKLNAIPFSSCIHPQCSSCEVSDKCKKNMCENCIIRGKNSEKSFLYRCKNIKIHLRNMKQDLATKEKNNEK